MDSIGPRGRGVSSYPQQLCHWKEEVTRFQALPLCPPTPPSLPGPGGQKKSVRFSASWTGYGTHKLKNIHNLKRYPLPHLVQTLWKTVWRYLSKLNIELLYDPAMPLLVIYPDKTFIEKDTCIPIKTYPEKKHLKM